MSAVRSPIGLAVAAAASLTIMIWGGTPIVTKIAVAILDPLAVGMLRTGVAALIAVPLILGLRLRPPATVAGWGLLVLSALGGFVAFPLLFSLGLRGTSAAHGALILATLPVLTGAFAALIDRAPPSRRWWLGAGVALAGEVALVGFRQGLGGGEEAAVLGDLLVVASCVAAAAGYVAGGRLARDFGSWPTTLWGIAAGGIVLAPVYPWLIGGSDWARAGVAGVVAIGYLALLSTILAYVAWYWALGRGGIARVGTTQFAQPLVSLALTVVLLGEPMTLPLGLAAVAIMAGVIVAGRVPVRASD